MPTISMFWGIVIKMFPNNDHNPPHFHAEYQGYKAMFSLQGDLLEGDFPVKEKHYVKTWALRHEAELEANWNISTDGEQPYKIEPLK